MARSGRIQYFKDLIAWQKSRQLSLLVYQRSGTGHFSKDYVLRDQIRKAAISITSNIAEGFERYSPKEFQQYLSIARGSAAEVRSQIQIAEALGYITRIQAQEIINLCNEIGRILAGLRKSLERK